MANLDLAGIEKLGGYLLANEGPLDVRTVVPEYDNLADLVADHRAYAGMIVYVQDEKTHYTYDGTNWNEAWGAKCTTLETGTDLNDVTTEGIYFLDATCSYDNAPADFRSGWLEVKKVISDSMSGNHTIQTIKGISVHTNGLHIKSELVESTRVYQPLYVSNIPIVDLAYGWTNWGLFATNATNATNVATKATTDKKYYLIGSTDAGDSTGALVKRTDTTTAVFVNGSGQLNAPSYNATSDARLKENFEPLIIEKSILDLPTYKFDFIDGAKNQIGCKAQDLQEICPEIVVENDNGYLSIQESKIVYLLLEEVKKLKAEIEVLKNKE